MTDQLSKRLEQALIGGQVKESDGSPWYYEPSEAQAIVKAILPILRDEITAAEEAICTEMKNEADKFGSPVSYQKSGALARHDAAVRERMLENAGWDITHRLGQREPSDGAWNEQKNIVCEIVKVLKEAARTLKTPQPEVSK